LVHKLECIISASLPNSISSVCGILTDLSPIPSVDLCVGQSVGLSVRKVYCGMVSGVGRVMGVLDGGGDSRRGRGSSGVKVECPIETNGDFVA